MDSRKILVITSTIDKTCDYIINNYPRVDFYRLDLDMFSSYQITITAHGFTIISEQGRITNKTCKSIYYRKPLFEELDKIFDSSYHNYMHRETYSVIEGIVESFGGKVLTKPSKLRVADNKVVQALKAKQFSFKIPDLFITNSHKSLAQLHTKTSVVKPISCGEIILNSKKEYVQTNIFDSNIEQGGLKYAPAYFQEYIEKDFESRVTIIGNDIFTINIHSENKIDWRKKNNIIEYELGTAPYDIEQQCKLFMKSFDIQFGCFDFIINNNEWYFLEMNANGQWAWLELETKANISESIVSYLNEEF